MRKSSIAWALGIVALLVAGCSHAPRAGGRTGVLRHFATAEYSLIDLGTLGGNFSYAADLNDSGSVVGWSSGNSGDRAFLFRKGRLTGLGVLVRARGINSSGTVVGVTGAADGSELGYTYRAGRYSKLGSAGLRPLAINDRGDIVGALSLSGNVSHPFLLRNGRLLDLGTLGGKEGEACSISRSGLVVGATQAVGRFDHAFLWSGGKMRDLGTLDGGYSIANRVNDRGHVVGVGSKRRGVRHAFLWQSGSMIDLGTLGGENSEAKGINEAGVIVGSSDTRNGRIPHAFIWRDGKMQDLNDLVDTSGDGWELVAATAINNAGQIAVVGRTNAAILTPRKGGDTGSSHLH